MAKLPHLCHTTSKKHHRLENAKDSLYLRFPTVLNWEPPNRCKPRPIAWECQ